MTERNFRFHLLDLMKSFDEFVSTFYFVVSIFSLLVLMFSLFKSIYAYLFEDYLLTSSLKGLFLVSSYKNI